MKTTFYLCLSFLLFSQAPGDDFLLVVGEPGEAEFAATFHESAALWKAHLSTQERFRFETIGLDNGEVDDLELMKNYLSKCDPNSIEPLWVVLHGHGTFDTKKAAFNLRGPDVTLTDLQEWLKPLARRPMVFINSSASSSLFIGKLKGKNRIVVTATQTTGEEEYSYFGQYLAQALQAVDADLDGDGSLSLLEAFLHASRSVEAHYKNEDRMVTEHALLDDNSDGRGTPMEFFQGMNAVKKPKSAKQVDGTNAHQFLLSVSEEESKLSYQQRAKRGELELVISQLRRDRKKLGEAAYYEALEKAVLELSEIYAEEEDAE